MKIYLDYAATTPLDREAEMAMRPYLAGEFGNAGSLHSYGQEAAAALDRSRSTVAAALGADFREVIFTGSATEANNLALRGVVKKARSKHGLRKPKIVVSVVEHESVIETARDLAREGEAELVLLPVNSEGSVDPSSIKPHLSRDTALISVMCANNEVGTIQPIREIGRLVREFREEGSVYPLFHTDVVQAFQYLPCRAPDLEADLMTISSHKIYGPKGAGALYFRAQTAGLEPTITGGGQEFGLRSGTENIPGVIGLANAVAKTERLRKREAERVKKLRDYLYRRLSAEIEVSLNGPALDSGTRLPNNLNLCFPGQLAENLLIALDSAGLAVSTGSACQSRATAPSHVLMAMSGDRTRALSSLRLTLGRNTTRKEIDTAAEAIIKIIKKRQRSS
jgi:cysteine desulfurase